MSQHKLICQHDKNGQNDKNELEKIKMSQHEKIGKHDQNDQNELAKDIMSQNDQNEST